MKQERSEAFESSENTFVDFLQRERSKLNRSSTRKRRWYKSLTSFELFVPEESFKIIRIQPKNRKPNLITHNILRLSLHPSDHKLDTAEIVSLSTTHPLSSLLG